ncbi:glutamyl-tRNA reductase [Clostridium collagenovorans DSM 3089]|uniref:Glutamyl-tRNA reductase n=1 Tax=Clostridium collagenovorans DSM 3089 TaxID=1121306 RepID=A0A1M5TVF4_9CLOT|nr:glutamyl-tRNA reductase [Clostridium collagenovorans]SHH54641.1 glutamyl-tRNA reductase [Clostridium collagenovorans DSM 3089]
MEIAVIGVNHNKTPINIREKVSFTEARKIEGSNYLLDRGIKEVIILSTCNRSEIYIAAKNVRKYIPIVREFYSEFFNISDIEEYLFEKENIDAIRHLYFVTSGLDSIVLGEDQILGQVKDSLLFSMEIGCSGKVLNKLFREAVTVAKGIKSDFKISEIPLSTSYIGIKYLKENIGSFKGKKALIIGTGKISSLALTYLEEEELGEVYITNRTHGKLKSVVNQYPHAKIIEYENRYEYLNKVDILISATAAPHTVIAYEKMPQLESELFILDLALPRDIDRRVAEVKGVTIYDIDDLKKVSDENYQKRIDLCNGAMDIIEDNIETFLQWLQGIKIDPIIKSLNDRCREIEEDTMAYINRKLELDGREQKIIEKMLKSSLKRLIREPIFTLKETKEEGEIEKYIETITDLFNF